MGCTTENAMSDMAFSISAEIMWHTWPPRS
jgi:hypothetical protein